MTRRRLWILPEFQGRMMMQWAALVLLSSLLTSMATMAFVWLQEHRTHGEYVFVSDDSIDTPVLINPTSIKRSQIILPGMLVALAMGIAISMLAGLYYSHRLAGPIYRIRRTLRETREGKAFVPILLRQGDEFKELAEDINVLLKGQPR